MKIINPATAELIREIPETDTAGLSARLASLRQGQVRWAQQPLNRRIETLRKYASLLEETKDSLAAVLTSEVGKPLRQSVNEVNGSIARIQWLTGHASQYLSDETMMQTNEVVEKISYEPLGVIANISAWNYPYLVGTNVFVPALLAGNAVIYKPSEFATLTGIEIANLLHKAGVPEDVFFLAIGGRSVGEALLDLPLDGYFFTGSYQTGKKIYEHVAPKMVPCQCEMGGKDPLYVAEDVANIAATAAAVADGAFYNNGQSCCAVERVYVHEKIYDRFVEEFVREVKSFRLGLPTEEGTYLGPLTRSDQLHVLQEQVDEALELGAQLHCGGKRAERPGFYFEPTVLTHVTHQMRVMREESFGPVIGIMPVRDDEEAVRLMGDTSYGLTAAVYSSQRGRAEGILKQINAGTGYWNCCDRVSAAVPWTGRKHSGFGSTLSHAGLRAFTWPRSWQLMKP